MRFCFLILLVACGGGQGPAVGIIIEPADAELTIAGANPATQTFSVFAVDEDGNRTDVTDRAQLSLVDTRLGSFTRTDFTSTVNFGGQTDVVANVDGQMGTTGLTLIMKQSYADPDATDLPADPSAPFGGTADENRNPELVYPNNGVLVPPNLGRLEFHFYPGDQNDLFEISYQNKFTDVKVYTRCLVPMNNGCIYTPDQKVWQWIATTNAGHDPLTVTVRGTTDAGTAVGTSASSQVRFSRDPIRGAIYYWTTTNNGSIQRFDFGEDSTQQQAELFADAGTANLQGQCIGCHALTRDGTKMVAEINGQNDGRLAIIDVATKTLLTASNQVTPAKTSIFETWNPTGTKFAGVFGDNNATDFGILIYNFDEAQGTVTLEQSVNVGADDTTAPSHPDWSVAGDKIVYTRMNGATGQTNQKFHHGQIEWIESNDGGTTWTPEVLVPRQDATNWFFPAFGPEGDYIALNRSECPAGQGNTHRNCNADTDPSAKLFLMEAKKGATPVALDNANAKGPLDQNDDLANTYPKWSPFVFQNSAEFTIKLKWLTFSSTRNCGLRNPPVPSNTGENDKGTLLWMTGVEPERLGAGEDPSYPAFCLPFQDYSTSNHIGQWTERKVSGPD